MATKHVVKHNVAMQTHTDEEWHKSEDMNVVNQMQHKITYFFLLVFIFFSSFSLTFLKLQIFASPLLSSF